MPAGMQPTLHTSQQGQPTVKQWRLLFAYCVAIVPSGRVVGRVRSLVLESCFHAVFPLH